VIRHKVPVEGRSGRAVARELGISRNIVRKYLAVAGPRRVEHKPRPRPVLERARARLEELLSTWRTTPKQRVTGVRLHQQLVEEGFRVSVHAGAAVRAGVPPAAGGGVRAAGTPAW
jgi:transposase